MASSDLILSPVAWLFISLFAGVILVIAIIYLFALKIKRDKKLAEKKSEGDEIFGKIIKNPLSTPASCFVFNLPKHSWFNIDSRYLRPIIFLPEREKDLYSAAMVPLAALILLSAVVVVATGTFTFAIYWTIRTRLEDKRLKDTEADSELRTPLTTTSAAPGLFARSPTPPRPVPPLPRPPTPGAEFPPPLPDETEDQAKKQNTPRLVLTGPPGPFLLPTITYQPPPTPGADSPPPLAKDFPGQVPSPLPPHSPLLPSPPPFTPSSKDRPKPSSRARGTSPNQRPVVPITKTQERPDSMHEIYDIYSQLPPTPKAAPTSAPPSVASFAQAESKWAYFGQKRAESRERERDAELA